MFKGAVALAPASLPSSNSSCCPRWYCANRSGKVELPTYLHEGGNLNIFIRDSMNNVSQQVHNNNAGHQQKEMSLFQGGKETCIASIATIQG